jgi:hypothetical protein
MTNQQEHIAQLENTIAEPIAELQSENKKLRKIIALSEDNKKVSWVKPKKKFFGND